MFWTRILPVSILSAVFVMVLGGFLPESLASHFGATGVGNGFQTRASFVATMVLVAGLLPALLWLLFTRLIRIRGGAFINLPNSEYWFSPERADETCAFLERRYARFTDVFSLFLCYSFALVVHANREAGGRLSMSALLVGEALLLVYLAVWLVRLIRLFVAWRLIFGPVCLDRSAVA